MSGTDDGFTNEQLTELALMQAETSAQTGKAVKDTAHQALAGVVMNALLLHELERLGLVDYDALMDEAVQRARSIQPPEVGASVARVIKAIFDGEALSAPHADLTDVDGGRSGAMN
jgi:hypothetical protein